MTVDKARHAWRHPEMVAPIGLCGRCGQGGATTLYKTAHGIGNRRLGAAIVHLPFNAHQHFTSRPIPTPIPTPTPTPIPTPTTPRECDEHPQKRTESHHASPAASLLSTCHAFPTFLLLTESDLPQGMRRQKCLRGFHVLSVSPWNFLDSPCEEPSTTVVAIMPANSTPGSFNVSRLVGA